MSKIKWSNIPIPVQYLLLLIIGFILQKNTSWHFFEQGSGVRLWGGVAFIAGFILSFWATFAVSEINIEKPSQVISTGPYAFSRNPMYLAWALMYAGISVWSNNMWMVVFFPVALLITHFYDIPKEEKYLREQFGEAYEQYAGRVRRYF